MDKPRTEKFLKDHGVTDWGTFNIAPTPIKKIDISDFWREYYSYGFGNPRDQEYRQVALEGRLVIGHILVYHDKIFLIEARYSGVTVLGEAWLIGCDHKFQLVNTGRCLNQLTCTECGYSYEVDSSD